MEGSSTFELSNVGLISSDGSLMATRIFDGGTIETIVRKAGVVVDAGRDTLNINDVDTTYIYALNGYNMRAIATDITFNPDMIELINISEEYTLSESNTKTTVFQKSINNILGSATLGISRAENNDRGIATNFDPLARIIYKVKNGGNTSISLTSAGLICTYEDKLLPLIVKNKNIYVMGNGPQIPDSASIFFNPDSAQIAIDSIFNIKVNVDSVIDLFGCALNINYDPNKLQFMNAVEGSLISGLDTVDTAFEMHDNLTDGNLTIGISRMSNIQGVSTLEAQELLNLSFKKLTNDTAKITFQDVNLFNSNNLGVIPTRIMEAKIYPSSILSIIISTSANWNMISVPLSANSMSKDDLFPNAVSDAYGFDNGYQIYSTLINGKGYWLKFSNAENLNIMGHQVDNDTIYVKNGWNIIGIFEEDCTVNNINSYPLNIITSSFYGYEAGYEVDTTLLPGKGYWVKVSQDGKLFKNQEIVPVQKEFYSPKIYESWAKLKIIDKNDTETILYLTDENLNYDLYELPPQPPIGISDIRFSTNRYVERLTDNSLVLLLSSVKYPIRIKVEGLNIKIKDFRSGILLNNTIRDGEYITINNQEINVLELNRLEIPKHFELLQNFPNPFNPSTKIKFALPEKVKVTLSLYSILGEKIEELIDSDLDAGYHEIEFNASNLSSGIYFYKIETSNYSVVKKMILLK
jgi:hypothetical protein